MIIKIHTKPASKKFEILGFNKWNNCLEIKTKEKAEKGQANKELEEKLQKLFKTKVKIVSGLKSRNKKLLIENKTEKEIKEKIKKL